MHIQVTIRKFEDHFVLEKSDIAGEVLDSEEYESFSDVLAAVKEFFEL